MSEFEDLSPGPNYRAGKQIGAFPA
jgi:hypothetical protein